MIQKIEASLRCDVLVFWDAMIFCHNFMHPKRRFWTVEQTVWRAFSKHFSTSSSPNPVPTPLKCASKRHSEMFGEHELYAKTIYCIVSK